MDTTSQYKAGMEEHMNFMIDACRLNLLHIKNSIKANNDIYRDPSKAKQKQFIYGLRRDTYLINGEFKAFHRVFVKCEYSGKYSYLGWVINDDAVACMVCQTDFFGIVTTGKHHCRACGILICSKCSIKDAVVAHLENYKPVRVCKQCYFEQLPVGCEFNYNQGVRICGNFYIPDENLRDAYANVTLHDLIDKKEFGPLYLLPVTPVFAIKSHFQSVSAREKVFVNITTCPYVPYNGKIMIGNERLIFMNVGERGTSISGVRVYDICVHPRVTEESFRDSDAFRQLCEQALLNVAVHDVNDTFQNYVIIPNKELYKSLRGTPNEDLIKDHFKGMKLEEDVKKTPSKAPTANSKEKDEKEKELEPYSEEFTNYIERIPIKMKYEGNEIDVYANKGCPQYFVQVLNQVDEKAKAKMTPKQLEDLKLAVQPVMLKENHNHDLEMIIMTIPHAKTFEALYTCSTYAQDVSVTSEHLTIFDYIHIADATIKEHRKKKRAAAKSGKPLEPEASSWFFNPFAFLFSSSPSEEEKKKQEEEEAKKKAEEEAAALADENTPADEAKTDAHAHDDDGIGENVILLDDNGYPIMEETKKADEHVASTTPAADGTGTAAGTDGAAATPEDKEAEKQAKLKAAVEKQRKLEVYRSRVTLNLYGSYDPSGDNHGKTIGSSGNSSFVPRDAHGNPLPGGARLTPVPSTTRKKVMLRPYPGFVIKTHLAGRVDQKVFINVYHHHHLEDMMKKENITLLSADDIFVLVGEEVHNVLDKQQLLSELYHVVVSSTYFHESYLDKPIKITNPEGIFKILENINDRYELQLDTKNYSLPRVKGGFKGERIPLNMIYSFVVRKLIASVPGEHRPVLSPNTKLIDSGVFDSVMQDDDSVDGRLSETSANGGNGTGTKRRSSGMFTAMFGKGNKGAITEEMVEDRPELCIDWQDVIVLKNYACEKPDALIGWQVGVYKKPNTSPEIYVVSGMRKTTARKTQYCLSHPQKADLWTGLKRSADKGGLIFRPNRKVYFPHVPGAGQHTPDDSINVAN